MPASPFDLQLSSDLALFVIGLITLMQCIVWFRDREPGMNWFAVASLAGGALVAADALPASPTTPPAVAVLLALYAIRGVYALGLTAHLALASRRRALFLGMLASPALIIAVALAAGVPRTRLPTDLPMLWADLGLAALCLAFAWRERTLGHGLLALAPLLGSAPMLLQPWRGPGPSLRLDYPASTIGFGIVVLVACLMRSTRSSRHAQAVAQRMSGYYAALSHTNQAILRIKDPTALYQEICRICVASGHARLVCVYLIDGRLATRVAQDGPSVALLNDVPNPWDIGTPQARASPTARSLTEGVIVVSHDYLNDPSAAPWREHARAYGMRALACLPLRRGGQVTGTLMLAAGEVGFFDDRLIELLAEMTADISFALDNIDREAAHRQSNREVEAGLARFVQLFQAAPIASVIVGLDDHRVVAVNDAMCARYRSTREEMIGRRTTELTYVATPEDRLDFYRTLRAQGRVRNLVATMVDAAGDRRQELMNAEVIDYLDRPCVLYMGTDITDLRKAEEAREALHTAQAANRAKTEFLSRMSHELRTPLNAVLGFSGLVREQAEARLTPGELAHLDHVQQAGWHLLQLIGDVLDLSRIEAGQFAVETHRLALAPLLDEALQMTSPLAVDGAIALVADYRDQPSCEAIADPTRLRQVVINVLTNAIKYNRHEGAVRVQVRARPGRTAIEVSDTGMGMTPHQLDQLFEPFNRLGRDRQGVEGTGIGLALSRQLMRLMDGDIEVFSEPGRGTRVVLDLPRADADGHAAPPVRKAEPPRPAPDHVPRGRVLYIEDNAVNTRLVEALLARWSGLQFLSAEDGETGLQLARAQRPDLILLDMQLPGIDGVEVLHRLRADTSLGEVPIIVLSATANADDVARARDAGATDYWTKPLDFKRFVGDVARLLRDGPAGP